jgi:hypothetical protein
MVEFISADVPHDIYVESEKPVLDVAKMSKLIQQDKSYNMEVYSNVLLRATEKGIGRTKQMLNLPGVNQNSPAYKYAVAEVYDFIGANHNDASVKILKMLLEKFQGEQKLKDKVLSSIFSNVANYGIDYPSVDAAKMLVENGADITTATAKDKEYFMGQRRSADRTLDAFDRFEKKVNAPKQG